MRRVGTFVIALVLLLTPVVTNAKTVTDFENEVARYTADLQAKQAKLAKNQAEVAEIRKKITNIQNQITEAEKEIEKLEEEIEKSNKEILKKSEESKKIMQYYQIENGDNAYLEYAFGAETITDMIYRVSIIEQLTEYNDKIMKELKKLIEDNQRKKAELKKKNEELAQLKKNLESEKSRIEIESASIKESMPSVETQIKEAKSNLSYFKKLGCGATEDILSCQFRVAQASGGSLPSVGTFARPMEYGYVTQWYSGYGGHLGIDLSSSNKTIAIHPIASGVVHAIYTDSCTSAYWCSNLGHSCNGNAKIVVIKHNYNGSYIYSSYVHLSSYGNIAEGVYVTKDTVIGYMGTTGCSTGPHLHLEIDRCFWKNNGGCTYATYERNTINPKSLINFPSDWNNR